MRLPFSISSILLISCMLHPISSSLSERFTMKIVNINVLSEGYKLEYDSKMVKTPDGWVQKNDTIVVDNNVIECSFSLLPLTDETIPIAYEAFCPACLYDNYETESFLNLNPSATLEEIASKVSKTIVLLEDEDHNYKTFNNWNYIKYVKERLSNSSSTDTTWTYEHGVNGGHYKCNNRYKSRRRLFDDNMSPIEDQCLEVYNPKKGNLTLTFLLEDLKVKRSSTKVRIHYFYVPTGVYPQFSKPIRLTFDWMNI